MSRARIASLAPLLLLLAACGARTRLVIDDEAVTTSSTSGSGGADAGAIGTRARTLSASWGHTCAVTNDGRVACWGEDVTARGPAQPTPTLVQGLHDIVEIGTGQSVDCARRKDGAVLCWGAFTMGRLVNVATPAITNMTSGPGGMCGIDADGNVRCNGSAFLPCMFAMPSFDANAPGVPGIANAKGVAVGQRHACAFGESGTTVCWGCGDDDAIAEDVFSLGSRSPTTKTPIAVPGVTSTIAISGDTESTCAVQSDGSTWCWGDASQFSTGIVLQPTGPVKADLPASPIDLDVGLTFTCAAVANEIHCVGGMPTFDDGCLSRSDTPRTFSVPGVVEVTVGYEHACARDDQGSVYCWGCNRSGEVGDGTQSPVATPVKVL
jgi:hypothetical protein